MTKAEFIEKISQRWDEIEDLENCTTFYEHEKSFKEIWMTLGNEVLETSIGEVPKDHRKKR